MNEPPVKFHKDFDKQLLKLPKKQRDKAIDAIDLFLDDPSQPILRDHALTGEWAGYRSISAGGNLRLHFRILDTGIPFFVAIGTHAQLYK